MRGFLTDNKGLDDAQKRLFKHLLKATDALLVKINYYEIFLLATKKVLMKTVA